MGSGGGLSGLSSSLDGSLPQRHWVGRRAKEQEPEKDRGSSREIQQGNMELELHSWMGKGVGLGTVA